MHARLQLENRQGFDRALYNTKQGSDKSILAWERICKMELKKHWHGIHRKWLAHNIFHVVVSCIHHSKLHILRRLPMTFSLIDEPVVYLLQIQSSGFCKCLLLRFLHTCSPQSHVNMRKYQHLKPTYEIKLKFHYSDDQDYSTIPSIIEL